MTFATGELVDSRYQVERLLSRGLLFDSYVARSAAAGLRVFLKIERETLSERHRRLAQAHEISWRELARLGPQGLPSVYDVGVVDGRLFQATQWIAGDTIHDLARSWTPADHPAAATMVRDLLEQGLATLSGLHRIRLVHGDISPHNILYSPGSREFWLIDPVWNPKLRDAGPGGSGILATAAWMAPEIRDGAQFGPSADLYSLGLVAREFARLIGADCPAPIHRLIDQLTEANPRWRPASAVEVVEALAGRTAASASLARPPPPQASSRRPDPASAGGPGFFPFVLLAGIAGLFRGRKARSVDDDGRRPPEPTQRHAATVPDAREGPDWSDRTGLSKVPLRAKGDADPRRVDFIVMGPTLVARERSFPLELWVGPSDLAQELRERASDRGRMIERGSRAAVEVPLAIVITAVIKLPGFNVVDPVEQIYWDGQIRNVAFLVNVPPAVAAGRHAGLVKLMVDDIPFGTISFWIDVGEGTGAIAEPSLRGEPVRRFRTAFASYSRRNSADVFKRVQAIRAASIDIFVDIANLRGGDRWKEVLSREIASREVFYLFWSKEAAQSIWVEREWREALDKRGLDYICPIPLDDPREAKPPPELSDLHFDDWCLAIIRDANASDRPDR